MLVFQATCGIAEGVNTFFLLYAVSYLLCQYLKCVLVGPSCAWLFCFMLYATLVGKPTFARCSDRWLAVLISIRMHNYW